MSKTKFGLTLAGRLWIERITSLFAIDGRLARGKTYFNKGLVKRFELAGHVVKAVVNGSNGLYTIYFKLNNSDENSQKITQFFKDDKLSLSSLLNGELSQDFFDWATTNNIDLFISVINERTGWRIKSTANYEASCTCYDFSSSSSPCKHIFAFWYSLTQEIDHNPKILLELNGAHFDESIIENSGENDFPLELVYLDESTKVVGATGSELKIIHQENANDFIMSLMPSNPPFAPIDYKDVLKEFYRANKMGLPQIIIPIHSEDIDKIERIFKEAKIEISCDKNLRANKAIIKHKIFRQEESILHILAPYIEDSNKLGCSIDLLNLTKLFLSFKCENGNGYYRYFYQLCRVGYLLLLTGAFIPTVIKERAKNRFFIAWTALLTKSFNEQLGYITPNAMPSIRFGQRGAFLNDTSGSRLFFMALFTDYVKRLNFMHKKMGNNPPEISLAFFRGLPYIQKTAGKDNIDKSIINAFSVFTLSGGSFNLNVKLEPHDDDYQISIEVKNRATCETNHLCVMLKTSSSGELLKLIAPLRAFLPEIETLLKKQTVVLGKESFESFILSRASLLSSLGVEITLPKELHSLIKPRLSLSMKSKKSLTSFLDLQKLLEYDWVIAVGEHQLSVEEFEKLVKEQGQVVKYKDMFITLSPDELRKILFNAHKKDKLTPFDALREKLAGNAFFDDNLKDFFANFWRNKQIDVPASLNATLRPYQTRGFEWVINNLLNNFGVILADDMGLGKTIQTIAVILYLYENDYAKKQALIVVPTSLLNNWQNEFSKFAPTLTITLYYGQTRNAKDAKIIITTYETLKRDESLKSEHFDIVVIDEAQKIKNPETKAAQVCKQVKAKYKIALSGTPVENSLSELWSIFDFSISGYLGTLDRFMKKYALPIAIENDTHTAMALKEITSPFMLRRLKTDKTIIDDLPDKIVIDEYASMTPTQAALYQNVVDDTMKKLEILEPKEKLGLVFKLITELKQICNHPRNFDKTSQASSSLSGKSELLLELLESIIARGEKVLIFTQYVEMANILCEIVEKELLIEPLKLDGSMSKKAREGVVDAFQNGNDHPIFILSLKAGGIGLNLTAASNVIHYDLWFNPAVENQATDRAFRIGQNNNVFVYRFITKNSFEEKIDNMIKAKLALGEMSVAVGENSISSMSNDEIKALFRG